MNNHLLLTSALLGFMLCHGLCGRTEPIQIYEFDQIDLASNGWIEIPGGFDQAPPARFINQVTIDESDELSTDQVGLQFRVLPGQVGLIFAAVPVPTTSDPVLIHAYFSSRNRGGIITLAAVKGTLITNASVDGSMATTSLEISEDEFQGNISVFFEPDDEQTVTPIIQFANAGNEEVTFTVDRIEITKIPDTKTIQAEDIAGRSLSIDQSSELRIFDFNESTLLLDGWNEIPGGFENRIPAVVQKQVFSTGQFPSSNDDTGITITALPNQVALLHTRIPYQTVGLPVLLRLTARSTSPTASLGLAVIEGNLSTGEGITGTISTHIPTTTQAFTTNERRLSMIYIPTADEVITPIIQVAGTGSINLAVVSIDRLEIIPLLPVADYAGHEFSSVVAASIPPTPEPILPPTATPVLIPPTPTPTVTPTVPQPTATPAAPAENVFVENEPNDSLEQPQYLTRIGVNESIEIRGNLSSGGTANNDYTGDRDHYRIEFSEAVDYIIRLEWDNTADVDIAAFIDGQVIGGLLDQSKPTIVPGILAPSVYDLLVVSKDQPASYLLTLETAPPSIPRYPNDVSILNGPYANFERVSLTTRTLHGLVFDGQGNVESWRSLNQFGEFPEPWWNNADWIEFTGTYEINYPFLIIRAEGLVSYTVLHVETSRRIFLNGIRYQ